jgi:hypothetical protein
LDTYENIDKCGKRRQEHSCNKSVEGETYIYFSVYRDIALPEKYIAFSG